MRRDPHSPAGSSLGCCTTKRKCWTRGPPCFPLAQHHRPGLPWFHCHGNHLQVPLPVLLNTLPLLHLVLSILVLTHFQGGEGKATRQKSLPKESPKGSSIIPLLSPQAGKVLSSLRALQDLAPDQGWCSGLPSSQQVRAPLTKRKRKPPLRPTPPSQHVQPA